MTDYKLVPMEPTEAMIKAAEDAYMPFGDMELALRMAILAAPAEQKPAPDVSGLVEALEGIMRVEARDRVMPVGAEWDAARAALAAHRKGAQP